MGIQAEDGIGADGTVWEEAGTGLQGGWAGCEGRAVKTSLGPETPSTSGVQFPLWGQVFGGPFHVDISGFLPCLTGG